MARFHGPRPWRWLLWALLLAAWTLVLVAPVPEPPAGPLGDLINTWRFWIAKAVHISVYAFFGILTGWLHAPARYRWLLAWFLMAHASCTELLQLNFSYRDGSLRDAALNGVGILLGMLLSWNWWAERD